MYNVSTVIYLLIPSRKHVSLLGPWRCNSILALPSLSLWPSALCKLETINGKPIWMDQFGIWIFGPFDQDTQKPCFPVAIDSSNTCWLYGRDIYIYIEDITMIMVQNQTTDMSMGGTTIWHVMSRHVVRSCYSTILVNYIMLYPLILSRLIAWSSPLSNVVIWSFPKIGVPPNHPF